MSYKDKRRQQKLKYALQREERAAERQSRIAKKRPKPPFTPLRPRQSRFVETDAMKQVRELPSHESVQSVAADTMLDVVQLDFSQLEARVQAFMGTEEGKLYERELAARKISNNLKSQTAPLFSKGPYQLITDPNAPKYFNKKDGGL